MTTTLKIDFVSDIACPWCAVGLGALEGALSRLQGESKRICTFNLLS
jgi:predicted DsbA family dithiol-disulfide isomerase